MWFDVYQLQELSFERENEKWSLMGRLFLSEIEKKGKINKYIYIYIYIFDPRIGGCTQ